VQIEPRFIIAAFGLIVLAGPVLAENPEPAPLTDMLVAICDAYGPGYRNIPGTDICLRVGGHVQLDVVGRFGKPPADTGQDGARPNR
jgi:hypothetical protein